MAQTKRERYESERQRVEQLPTREGIPEEETELILEFLSAKDSKSHAVSDSSGTTKADSTIARYANLLYRVEEIFEFELTEVSADKLNESMDLLRRGDPEEIKDEGYTAGTVKTYQTTLRKFYEYHDLGVDKEDIALANPDSSSVDERDLYDNEDIKAIRSAAKHPRDRALVDMLLYTGQRISALLNLRLKDINPDDGSFYLNEEAGELKGAEGKRPLLYAAGAVGDWYHNHPCLGDPDARFITHKHEWENASYGAGDRLDNSTIYRQLQRIGDRAGVNKPMNAHNFRHTFVTLCKRDYGMDNDTIKRLIGHRPDSRIMETTYAHLTDDDVIAAAERATDLRDEEPESPLTPDVCDICGEVVQHDDAKACPGCGTVFTPDAQAAEKQLQEDVKESYKQSDPQDELTQEGIETIDELLQNPEIKQVLMDRINAD